MSNTPTPSLIDLKVDAGIATLTLNRPDKRNAITDAMRTELIDALEQVTADGAIRALVLTGAGKGFCAGGDVAGMQRRMDAPAGEVGFNGWARQQRVHHSVALLHTMPKPVIAAVNGGANGLGADMALACDFVIASESAYFLQAFVNIGLIPDGGASWLLPRLIGKARATELMMLGEKLSGEKAAEWGLVYRCVPEDALSDEADALAARLAAKPTVAIGIMGANLHNAMSKDLSATLDREADGQRRAANSGDAMMNIKAQRLDRELWSFLNLNLTGEAG